MDFFSIVNYFISLLVICSPLSALPAFLALTHGKSHAARKRIGIVAGCAVGIILIVVVWIGTPLLEFLGIRVPAFQFAGGFVVFLLALSMLRAEQSPMKGTEVDQEEASHKPSIAVVPLAIPIMAGPGAISRVIVAVNDHPGILSQLTMSFSAILVAFVMGAILYFAPTVERVLGYTGINIINRLGGLILAAMAVESMAVGIIGLFPLLKSPI